MTADGEIETIGQRLRRLRTERGLSQRELAAPGVSYAYISRIEAGTRQPSVKALRKLARKLGVSAEYLETGLAVGVSEQRELRLAQAELDLRLAEDTSAAERELAAVVSDAEEAGDHATARRARAGLGLAAFNANRLAEAADLLERATHEDELGPTLRPDLYATLGRSYSMLGQNERAIELFERCLDELSGDGAELVPARVRFATYLSFALTDAGELDRAESVLREVLDDVDAFADPYTQVRVYWSLGRLAGHKGRASESLDYLRRAIALLEATDDTVHLARAHLSCAWSLLEAGRAPEAGPYLAAAERLFGSRPAAADLAALRTEQARQAVATEQAADAVRFAREALEAVGDGFPEEQAHAWLALAEGLVMEGEPPAADEAFRHAVDAFDRAGKPHHAATAYRGWGRLLRQEGREAEALDALEKAADLAVRPPAETRPRA